MFGGKIGSLLNQAAGKKAYQLPQNEIIQN